MLIKAHINTLLDYNDYNIDIPLYIKLPQMNAYDKCFDRNGEYMNLLVHDKEIIKKHNKIWNKIKNSFIK